MAEVAVTETSLTIDEVASVLRVSRRTVDRLQADGVLVPLYQVSLRGKRTRRFRISDVEKLLDRRSA